jgi:hypothetical protein
MTDETPPLPGQDDSSSLLWRKALSILSEREGSVLSLRHGAFGGESLSFSEIGEQLGISRQRAHQLYEGALERLVGNEELRALVPAIAGPKLATKVASSTPRPSAKREEPVAPSTDEAPPAKRGPGRPMDPQETERRLAALARVSAGELTLDDAAHELGLRPEALRGWLAYRRKIGASGGIPAELEKVSTRKTSANTLRPAPSRKPKPLARTRAELDAESAAAEPARAKKPQAPAPKVEAPKVAVAKSAALRSSVAKSASTASAGIDALLVQLEGLQRFHSGVESRVRELLEFIEREMPR